ncbi:hypothetical protein Pla108_38230 [Botrimarina colliarenosi]|uniref:Uncharacterized protein n=1 Tax=Botrimarina colliarenosi TaxID=2528001 RepID=A0A5C6A4X8_9BACT|nr:hypothetical protein Pla108_38230 [Botrimarina colliarenosi]
MFRGLAAGDREALQRQIAAGAGEIDDARALLGVDAEQLRARPGDRERVGDLELGPSQQDALTKDSGVERDRVDGGTCVGQIDRLAERHHAVVRVAVVDVGRVVVDPQLDRFVGAHVDTAAIDSGEGRATLVVLVGGDNEVRIPRVNRQTRRQQRVGLGRAAVIGQGAEQRRLVEQIAGSGGLGDCRTGGVANEAVVHAENDALAGGQIRCNAVVGVARHDRVLDRERDLAEIGAN